MKYVRSEIVASVIVYSIIMCMPKTLLLSLYPTTTLSTMPRLTWMACCITVEWNFHLRGCLDGKTMWSMPLEAPTPCTPSTSCSGPILGPFAWPSWPNTRLKQTFMALSSLRDSLSGTIASLSCVQCGCTWGTILICQMRNAASWSWPVPTDCTRYGVHVRNVNIVGIMLQWVMQFISVVSPSWCVSPMTRRSSVPVQSSQVACGEFLRHPRSWMTMKRCGTLASTNPPGVSSRKRWLSWHASELVCCLHSMQQFLKLMFQLLQFAQHSQLSLKKPFISIRWVDWLQHPTLGAWFCDVLLISFCRHFGLCYPHFPTEQDFIHSVLTSGDIQSHTQGGDLYLLDRFAQEWPQLQAGGLLLPDLLEFYQWLHTALCEPVLHSPSDMKLNVASAAVRLGYIMTINSYIH